MTQVDKLQPEVLPSILQARLSRLSLTKLSWSVFHSLFLDIYAMLSVAVILICWVFGICFIVFSWSSCKAYLVVNLICICSVVNKTGVVMLNGPSLLQKKRRWISPVAVYIYRHFLITEGLIKNVGVFFLKNFERRNFMETNLMGKLTKRWGGWLVKVLSRLWYCSVFHILMWQFALTEGQQWLLAFFFHPLTPVNFYCKKST